MWQIKASSFPRAPLKTACFTLPSLYPLIIYLWRLLSYSLRSLLPLQGFLCTVFENTTLEADAVMPSTCSFMGVLIPSYPKTWEFKTAPFSLPVRFWKTYAAWLTTRLDENMSNACQRRRMALLFRSSPRNTRLLLPAGLPSFHETIRIWDFLTVGFGFSSPRRLTCENKLKPGLVTMVEQNITTVFADLLGEFALDSVVLGLKWNSKPLQVSALRAGLREKEV